MDHTGHARLPKSAVKKMAESTSLVGWPMDFRKAISTQLCNGGQPIAHERVSICLHHNDNKSEVLSLNWSQLV